MTTETQDPVIEIMARAMSADQGFAWEACSQGDWARDAQAAIRALDAAGYAIVRGWQPMDTAPKDGTQFLAMRGPRRTLILWACTANKDHGAWYDEVEDEEVQGFSCWMPIHSPPSECAA